jgi:hypothetical protein
MIDVVVNHDVVAQRVLPTRAVGVKFILPKSDPRIVKLAPLTPGALITAAAVTSGASYEKADMSVPIKLLICTLAVTPVPKALLLRPQTRLVLLVQPVVAHAPKANRTESPSPNKSSRRVAVGVRLVMPKLKPKMVVVEPPVIGPFLPTRSESTGASNVNVPAFVPTIPSIVIRTSIEVPVPTAVLHTTEDKEFHDAEAHEVPAR